MHRSSLSIVSALLTAASLSACAIQGPGPDEDPTPGNDDGFVAGPTGETEPGNESEPGPGDLAPTDPGTDPTPPDDPDPDPPQQNGPPQVCYPGPAQDYTVCLPVVPKDGSFGSAYSYPSHSSPSYQPPLRFLDLTQHAASTKLAPNFSLGELMQEWKGDYAVYQVHMVEKLQTLRDQTGGALNINSGYRSPAYNGSVGGATYSRHMYGDAADMASSVVSLNSMKTRCNNLGADYVGMYTSHIHCDWRYSTKDPAFYGSASQMNVMSPSGQDSPFEANIGAAMTIPLHGAIMGIHEGAWFADATGFDEGEPYREWTALDADGGIIEVVAATRYEPPAEAASVEVMIGGRVALRSPIAAPHQATTLAASQVVVRLETLADHPERAAELVNHAH